jgi:hypothetical protein
MDKKFILKRGRKRIGGGKRWIGRDGKNINLI